MAMIAGESNIDTLSIGGEGMNCSYAASPLGAPYVSPNVKGNKFGGANAKFFSNFPEGSPGDPVAVAGAKIRILEPPYPSCPPEPRTLVPVVNKTVHINGKLVAVVGDQANIAGQSPRPIVNVGQYPKIILNTKNP